MDDDDEERSRSIPSRTKIGKRAAIISKFPHLGEPLILFGGLITVPFWGYRNLSMAMLEIMMSDLPRVEYKDKDKITEYDIKETKKHQEELDKRKGMGIGANLSKAINAKNFIQQKTRGI